MKRKIIYILCRKIKGIDPYVEAILSQVKLACESMALICGTECGEQKYEVRQSDEAIIFREERNEREDYLTIFEQLDEEKLEQWDEIIFMDDSLMGPVYPIREMLSQMEERQELDFWGLSACGFAENRNANNEQGTGELQLFIPFRFMAFRKKILNDPAFREAWKESGDLLKAGKSASETAYALTRFLTAAGFRWDTYVKTPEDRKDSSDFLLLEPVRAIRDEHCPFFLRNTFTCPQMEYISASAGEQPWELFRYLERETDYDESMILESLIRTEHQDDIARTLRMSYVLPSEDENRTVEREQQDTGRIRVALVMHLYYMDLLKESFHYASSMPEDTDLYIFTSSPKNEKPIRDCFQTLRNPLTVRATQNRGRDIGSMLIESRELQERYDLICFYHDKKSNHISPHTAGSSFAYTTAECVLSSKAYVRNVIALFEKKPYLGMLSGPTPKHGNFLSMIGAEWGTNYSRTKELAEKLGIRVPMSEDHIPAIGLGDVFWYRTKAMEPMFRKKWTYEDFPEEPVGMDGTILHAIERLYPFAVQEAGYLPGRVMPDHMASLELFSLEFYVREYNKVLKDADISGDIRTTTTLLKERTSRAFLELARSANFPDQLRLTMERHLPGWLYRIIYRKK